VQPAPIRGTRRLRRVGNAFVGNAVCALLLGSAALAGRRYGDTRFPADHASLPANVSICSDSWYHQDAVDEAKPTWER